jgi:imidazolonepropionase-like amidohydrolase
VILALLALWSLDPTPAPALAIEHARIHPGDGRVIEDGTVVVRAGVISAVGAGLTVPDGARRLDAHGAWLTPGLIDAEAQTGLAEVSYESTTVELGLDEHYDVIRPAFSVLDGYNPRSIVIPITRIEGVTSSALGPRGGLVSGRGAFVRLAGATVDEVVLRSPTAVYASAASAGRAAAYGARGGVLLRLRELIDDVRQYARRRQDFERNQMRKVGASRLDLDALIPVAEGKLPLVVEAHRASDIEAVLRFARENKLRLILTGAEEGWLVAPAIAAAKVPVIASVQPDLPHAFESLGARVDNATRLMAAGVTVALSPREDDDHRSRALRFEAGNAVAAGLTWEAALTAVTRTPAEIFDVADQVGTVAPGKRADLVLWGGDPFEPLTRPQHVFIGGREVPLRSRQTELRDRYRDLRTARPGP